MRRLALLVAVVAGCGHRTGARPPPRDAAARIADAAPIASAPIADAAPPRHPFVTGTVIVAAFADGLVRPLRLDPAGDRWLPLGSGPASLFPTEVDDGDAVLAIAAQGDRETDHVEQLAWVRGAAVERFGPRAGAIRDLGRAATGAIVFESSLHGFADLYRLDRSTAAPVRLTDDPAGNFEPALSPDGRTIAFSSSRDDDVELYRMPAAGGRATRLTASPRDDWSPRWSPDGRRLVFLSDREHAQRAFVADADGTHLGRLTGETDPDVVEDRPRWSPDGRTVAILRTSGGATSTTLVTVSSRAARSLTPDGATDTDLAWSPDGAYLLVARKAPATARARVVFVRIADAAVVATDDVEPFALRWFPAAAAR